MTIMIANIYLALKQLCQTAYVCSNYLCQALNWEPLCPQGTPGRETLLFVTADGWRPEVELAIPHTQQGSHNKELSGPKWQQCLG